MVSQLSSLVLVQISIKEIHTGFFETQPLQKSEVSALVYLKGRNRDFQGNVQST